MLGVNSSDAKKLDFKHFLISTGQLFSGQSLDPPTQMSKAIMSRHQPLFRKRGLTKNIPRPISSQNILGYLLIGTHDRFPQKEANFSAAI